MVSSQSLNSPKMSSLSSDTPEIHTLSSYRRLSVLNGLLIGLAIAVGFWAFKLYTLSRLPIAKEIYFSGALVSSLLIVILCMIVSWVSGRINQNWLTILMWLVACTVIPIILGFIPAYGRNLSVWFNTKRFWGLYVYAIPENSEWWSFIVAGLALIFILFILAVLQAVRLERAFNDLRPNGKLSTSAFFILLLPTLFVALGAYIMPDHLSSAPRGALVMTHEAIQVVQDFGGDTGELFDLTREAGFNYSALNGVREQLDGTYSLMVGEVDPFGSQIMVVAHFDTGSWINCQINAFAGRANYFSFCTDASRPYIEGFASLITSQPLPENCFGCLLQVNAEWQIWLKERNSQLNGPLQFERLAQQGNAVWMRATAADRSYAIDCLFTGIADVQLQECQEVNE